VADSWNQENHENAEVVVLQFEVKRMREAGSHGIVEEKRMRVVVVGFLFQGKVGWMGEVEPSDQLVHHLKKVVVVLEPMVQGVHTGSLVMVDTNLVVIGILQEVSSGTVVMIQMNRVVCMGFEVIARTNRVVSMGFGVMTRMNLAAVPALHQGVNKDLVVMAQTNSVGEIQVVCCKREVLRLG
jgi:hypothetical protein